MAKTTTTMGMSIVMTAIVRTIRSVPIQVFLKPTAMMALMMTGTVTLTVRMPFVQSLRLVMVSQGNQTVPTVRMTTTTPKSIVMTVIVPFLQPALNTTAAITLTMMVTAIQTVMTVIVPVTQIVHKP